MVMTRSWRWLGRPAAPGMVAELALSADGALVVACVVGPEPGGDADRRSLWVTETTGTPRWERLGAVDDDEPAHPRFAPSGTDLVSAGQHGLLVLDAAGGSPALYPAGRPAGPAAWDPEARRIAFAAAPPDTALAAPLLRATEPGFDLDGRGWLSETVRQIHIASPENGTAEAVTKFPADCADVSWGPEGNSLLYVSSRHEGRFRDFGGQVFLLDLSDGTEQALTEPDIGPRHPVYLRNGSSVVVAALTGAEGAGRTAALYAVDLRDGTRTRLTDPETFEVAHPLTSMASGVFLTGDTAVTLRVVRGAVEVVAVAPGRPGDHWTLLGGQRQIGCLDANAAGIAAAAYSAREAGEVWTLAGDDVPRLRGRTGRRTPRVADEDGGDTKMELRALTAIAPDGVEIDGWLALPRTAGGPLPLVVWLHGGPGAQAGWLPPPDARALAGDGLACLYLNPRGSVGRGEAFARGLLGRLGEVDRYDVLAVLDAARQTGLIDVARIGLHGVSYGGYLAGMLWSGHDVFRAAVVERGITSWTVHRAISDHGIAVTDGYWRGGPPPPERPDPMNAPLRNRSPVLLLAAEEDRRCPAAESRLLFNRLYEAGVAAELAILPGTGHNVGAAAPRVRRARAALLREWWARHLAPDEGSTHPTSVSRG